jgi:hypothetical protein
MPVVAVDKDGDSGRRKDDIRLARKAFDVFTEA